MYEASSQLRNIATKKVPLDENFQMDTEGVLAAVDDNTKIVFVCSPNNPTGNLMKQKDICRLCEEPSDHCLVVVDETYIEFTDRESAVSRLEQYDNLVALRTLSKSYAGAGYRCGVAISNNDIIELLRKGLAVYPVPAPVVDAVLKTLEPENKARLDQKRAALMEFQKDIGARLEKLDDVQKVYPSDSNFLLLKVNNSRDFVNICKSAGIIVRDQSSQPGLDNCVRVSVGSPEEMDKMIRALSGEDVSADNGRRVSIARNTKETDISVDINLDQSSPVKIATGIGFYDHMLEQIAKHAGISIVLECSGDLHIDNHHTIEDCAIALGQGLKKALGDKAGIGRYGFALPMDESQATCLLDLGGRYYLKFEADFPDKCVGDMPVDLVEHVFRSLAENLQANIHIKTDGDNTHHMVEACFKSFGRALRQAVGKGQGDELPSTKGML